jgi:flavin-binding protein dodecin
MSVARVTEIIAASPKSFEDAVQVGIARANKTLQNVGAPGLRIKRLKSRMERSKSTAWNSK